MTANSPGTATPDGAGANMDAPRGTDEPCAPGPGRGRTGCVPFILLACVAVVVFWQVMSALSRRAGRPYKITASTLESFSPSGDAWRVKRLPILEDKQEPHVAAFRLDKAGQRPVVTRLVHGYNMCDCMRIKGHEVTLLRDTRGEGSDGRGDAAPAIRNPQSAIRNPLPVQVWRLTSPTGDSAIWATSMLASYDFSGTDVDTRSMAFPRANTPDDPNYSPQGITLKGLKHPVRHLRTFLNAHWNKSRCDWLTFIGLRKPAWASRTLFTLVSASRGASLRPENEEAVIGQVLEIHTALHAELVAWRAAGLPVE
jgi:hypothetical protein